MRLQTFRINRKVFDTKAKLILKRATGRQHAFMLGGTDQNAAALAVGRTARQAQQGEVIGFGCSRGEDNLIGVRANQPRDTRG